MSCCFKFCDGLYNACSLISTNIGMKMGDDLLIGNEHTRKISPDCESPDTVLALKTFDISNEEKQDIVLNDPKFGMLSLFKYHINRGYRNEELKKDNTVYCTHIFSLYAALPILIFLSQWMMYAALLANEYATFDGNFCPNRANWYQKLLMSGVSILYFVKSFYIWDNLTKRTKLSKVYPCLDAWVIVDTFQEFVFNICVYGANLWIIFVEGSIQDMILNSIAMEFLMQIDNEFEEYYFKLLPHAAIDIYDNVFVTTGENRKLISDRMKNSGCFRCLRCISYIPFKFLLISLLIFPVFSFSMIFYGPLCK